MPSPGFRYDDVNMWSKGVGSLGVTPAEWKQMLVRLRAAKKAVQTLARRKDQGFLDLPFDRKAERDAAALAKKLSRSFTDMVVLGIGGSDLGARALQQALVNPQKQKRGTMRVHFAGASTDPDALVRLLETLDLKKTCVNIVSKSGDTLEPMSAFLVLRDRLLKTVGAKRLSKHIIATTDPFGGSLRALAEAEGYATLPVPGNVGGRFSVLSPVGLFPAAAMGIDTAELLNGARAAVEAFHENAASECPACRFAGLHALGAEKRKQRIQVTVAYSAFMSEFGRWIRQLVAESLGKKKNRKGKAIHAGITPIACVGPEDQHSQLQLWSQGPTDKIVSFMEIATFHASLITPDAQDLGQAIQRFGNRSFAELIHAERKATAEALRQDGRPNGTLVLERLDERVLGELIVFFELSVALMGELFDINAYDQPGVELSKKIMREQLL